MLPTWMNCMPEAVQTSCDFVQFVILLASRITVLLCKLEASDVPFFSALHRSFFRFDVQAPTFKS